ncbi:MAG: serine hydrolase domain-containing protein [Chthoniobacterales bacterium]
MTKKISTFSLKRLARADKLIERFIDEEKIAGAVTLVAHRGEVIHFKAEGWQDRERQVPMQQDSLFRIYSLTKIITSVALFTLYERGLLDLNDPIHRFLPGFRDLSVRLPDASLVPSRRDVTIYDLLRHCGGLDMPPDPDELRASGHDLESLALEWSTKPLIAQPGEKWIYGISTDILARIVEVVSGQSFDNYLQKTIFTPLGMKDTSFFVDDKCAERLCVCYSYESDGKLHVQDGNDPKSPYRSAPKLKNGGFGLVSSTDDYYRFTSMLLGQGRLESTQILGRKMVDLMTMDHLPTGHPNLEIGTQSFRFGLGVSVVTDVARTRCLSSLGEFGWGGAAGTQVWINPEEELIAMIMIQVRSSIPTGVMDIYKRLVYQSLV